MIVLADNDIILKLAQCDLLDSLDVILGVNNHEILISTTARFQLMPKNTQKELSKCGNDETVARVKRFLLVAKDVPVVNDLDLLVRLSDIPGIDSGEQQLFASTATVDGSLLITGDKKALRAVALNQATIEVVYKALLGNVITFESALLLALQTYGFPVLKQKLLACPKPDKMLQLVLRPDMTEAALSECLVSYTKEFFAMLASKDRLPESLRS